MLFIEFGRKFRNKNYFKFVKKFPNMKSLS